MAQEGIARRAVLIGGAAGAALWKGGLLSGCAADPAGDTDAVVADPPPFAPPEAAVAVLKGPWVTVQGAGRVRLRFETRDDVALPVRTVRDSAAAWHTPERAVATLRYERIIPEELGGFPDEPGDHVLHDVVLDGLNPGETVAWELRAGGDTVVEGTFRVPPAAGEPARLVWIADTMTPNALAAGAWSRVAEGMPDLVVHGGDLTYDSLPTDTWNRLFDAMRPALAVAPFHAVIGNHEGDLDHELEEMYDRLFAGQGDPAADARQHAFTLGSARVVLLDSETTAVTDAGPLALLEAEVAAAEADPAIKTVIVGFHRPVLSLSKYYDASLGRYTGLRDAMGGRVALVLCGHAHCAEHFDLDGVHYLVDGGGGALLYDVDEDKEIAERDTPDVVAARVHAVQTYGHSRIDIAPDGTLTVTRVRTADGVEEFSFTVPPSLA